MPAVRGGDCQRALRNSRVNLNTETRTSQLRRAVIYVALVNFSYFFVEFAVARNIGSVSLFADSIDFLEDASVNFLVLVALGWSVQRRARGGLRLALLLLIPGIATAWMAWQQVPGACAARGTGARRMTGLGALARQPELRVRADAVRNVAGSLSRAAFLSARNDALANLAIIAAGVVTLLLGLGLARSRRRRRNLPAQSRCGPRCIQGRTQGGPRRA